MRLEIPKKPDGTTDIKALAKSLTLDEISAMEAEIEYLEPHATDDRTWEIAALEGRCYCAGRFVCTRCQITAKRLGLQ